MLLISRGFFVLGVVGYQTYSGQPPIPEWVVDPAGDVVFIGEDVKDGQKVFLKNGLMQYGSVFGHGGRPQICNHCPSKTDCIDSDDGREVVRAMDPWSHSEADRFHRGISLAVALVAAPILAAVALRNHAPLEFAVLGAALLVVALTA